MESWDTPERRLDVVIYGATGFVGRLVAEYLAGRVGDSVRIGLAGRSRDKLEQVRAELGPAAAGWQLLIADATDDAALRELARSTRVVATTVGPYTRYGLPLVKACAEAGTHYADLAGEVLFIRESAARFHRTAQESGARIVHACGFDSVPSDLAVLLVAEAARADDAGELRHTTMAVRSVSGGISGGTIDSLRLQVDAAGEGENRRILADPYALSPRRSAEPEQADEHDPRHAFRNAMTGTWTAPFPMAPINTRIVRRSNALQDWAYGRRFRYREVVDYGSGGRGAVRAGLFQLGLGVAVAGFALPPVRWVLDRILSAPGEGPSEKTRKGGSFRIEVLARTTTNADYRAVFAAQGDPGYAATSVMLGESALALAFDGARLPERTGVLTPATALGTVLGERLRKAGFEIGASRVEAAPAHTGA